MAQQFRAYEIGSLLPGNRLILNHDQGILSLLMGEEILEQHVLTPNEMYVIEELLKTYPEYCPNEVLLSAMTGQSIEMCQEKVLWGLEEGAVDVVMRPVRNLLARCRMKLRPFGIEIKSLTNVGYVLIPLKGRVRTHAVAVS
jgi:hypothetical protein